jgi:hypothetical protein
MQLDRRLVGWGLIFILVGAIPLAVNAGLLDEGLVARWTELWPLLIIALGISLLLSRTPAAWVGSLVAAIVVGSMAGGLLATGFTGFSGLTACGGGTANPFPTQSGTLGATGRINLEFNCGELAIDTIDGSTWQLSGNDGDGEVPQIATAGDVVTIKPADRPGVFFHRGDVHWALTVPRAPQLDLGVTLNAGEGKADLSGAQVRSFNVTVNAGSLTTNLGSAAPANAVNMTVNAGSASLQTGATSGTFNLSLNAGSLDVCLPAGSAVRVTWHGTLASHDLDTLGLAKVDDHTWTSQGFDAAQSHVELDVNANAGSFGLNLGGGCGA